MRFVEKAYRCERLTTILEYTDDNTIALTRPNFGSEYSNIIVKDLEHKQYLIAQQAQKITDEMLSRGYIEIKDIDNDYNPYIKRTSLRVKVYVPEKSY